MKKSIKKTSKYKNIKSPCLSRHIHDSKDEAGYCNRLLAQVNAKEIYGFEIQKSVQLIVNKALICRHVIDFAVFPNEADYAVGTYEAHEFKGFETDVWKIKRKLFQALYPENKYKVIRRGRNVCQNLMAKRFKKKLRGLKK